MTVDLSMNLRTLCPPSFQMRSTQQTEPITKPMELHPITLSQSQFAAVFQHLTFSKMY
jgi:hypothetical protein